MQYQNTYIETLGEGFYEEQPKRYSATVTLSGELPAGNHNELAALGEESAILVSGVLDTKRQSLEKVTAGGVRFFSDSSRMNKPKICLERRYVIATATHDAIDSLAMKFVKLELPECCRVSFRPSQPEYDCSTELKHNAYSSAVEDARIKANAAMSGSTYRVSEILSAKQLALGQRASGAFGDDDWRGDADRFTPRRFGVGSGEDASSLDSPTRMIFVRFLVRFSLKCGE